MAKNNVGRPTKFNESRCAAIIKSISNRIPYEIAAEANGICEDTLYEWISRGRKDLREGKDTDFSRFSEMIKNTELVKIQEHLDCIKSMPERWQAQAWILERRWWKHFSPSAAVVDFEKRLARMEEDANNGVQNGKIDSGKKE